MSDDFYQSFDARVWANAFVEAVTANPAIATDVEAMTTWFASALMRGFDERRPEHCSMCQGKGCIGCKGTGYADDESGSGSL